MYFQSNDTMTLLRKKKEKKIHDGNGPSVSTLQEINKLSCKRRRRASLSSPLLPLSSLPRHHPGTSGSREEEKKWQLMGKERRGKDDRAGQRLIRLLLNSGRLHPSPALLICSAALLRGGECIKSRCTSRLGFVGRAGCQSNISRVHLEGL